MKRPEQALQIAVARYLDMALPADAIWWHTPNGGGRSKAEAGIFKAMGVKAGIPDIMIAHEASVWGIELKADKNPPSDNQLACHERLRAAGCPVAVCRSVDDVYAVLSKWNFAMRGRPSA